MPTEAGEGVGVWVCGCVQLGARRVPKLAADMPIILAARVNWLTLEFSSA